MSLDPRGLLAEAHPALAAVVKMAAQTPQPFQIVYTLRSPAAEAEAVASGHSQTLHSRHLADANYGGKAMAIDFACLDANGEIDWTVSNAEGGIYGQAAQQILAAAEKLGVPVEWGGAAVGAWVPGQVSHFHDWGHVQLPWAQYP